MRQNKTKFVEIRAEWKKPDTCKNDSEEKSSDKSFNFEEAEKNFVGQRCSTTTATTTATFYGHNYPILFKKQIESIEATVKRRRSMNFTASRMLTDTIVGVFLNYNS